MRATLHLSALVTFALASALATGASAASDQGFLRKALKGDNSEITLGQLAATGGGSPGVRRFGRMLVEDHSAAKRNALPVAAAHGVRDTGEIAPEARKEEGKLRGLHGAAFDREFAGYMIDDHRKDIADFEKQVRTGDQATRRLARETLPALRRHLQMARDLAQS